MNNIKIIKQMNTKHSAVIKLSKGVLTIQMGQLSTMRHTMYKSTIDVGNYNNLFTGIEIKTIIEIINSAERKCGNIKFPVYFILNNINFIDKLTYVFFECICYYLIKEKRHPVYVQMSCEDSIQTQGIKSSPLLLLQTGKKEDNYRYVEKFDKDIYRYHYRRIISGEGREKTNYLGDYQQQIDVFLKVFGINDECRDKIALVCTELAGNAVEHAGSECIVDIDVAPGYIKVLEDGSYDDKFYYGINIAIVNFSETLLGDGVKRNILQFEDETLGARYQSVIKAFETHKLFFDDEYREIDFCNVTTFQNKISGRPEHEETGGTGLPKLIKSLQEMSETYRCYVISGSRCVNFYNKTLGYDADGWIGFNDSNDYFSDRPNKGVCTECLVYMPGTAYNLNFIMQGVKIENGKN